jgi:Fe-S cluster assembly scaffold protein SufB
MKLVDANSLPTFLDIHTKEIKCQHGCTVSNVNEEHIYYLQSKGMDKSQATDLLVESFLC